MVFNWFARLPPGTTIFSPGAMDFTDHDFIADHMEKVVDNKGMYNDYVKVYQESDKNGHKLSTGTPDIFSETIENSHIKDYDVTEIRAFIETVNMKGVSWKILHIIFRLSITSERAPSIVSVSA